MATLAAIVHENPGGHWTRHVLAQHLGELAKLVSHSRPCEPGAVKPTHESDRGAALRQVREVIERLVRDGTAVARSDGSVHTLFPVAASAPRPRRCESGSRAKARRRPSRSASAMASQRCSSAKACASTAIPPPDMSSSTQTRQRGHARSFVLLDQSRMDARGGISGGRSPPVGRPPHWVGARHATVRLLRRILNHGGRARGRNSQPSVADRTQTPARGDTRTVSDEPVAGHVRLLPFVHGQRGGDALSHVSHLALRTHREVFAGHYHGTTVSLCSVTALDDSARLGCRGGARPRQGRVPERRLDVQVDGWQDGSSPDEHPGRRSMRRGCGARVVVSVIKSGSSREDTPEGGALLVWVYPAPNRKRLLLLVRSPPAGCPFRPRTRSPGRSPFGG